MLNQFFTQPKVLRRLQEGVFGPYLPAFARTLQQEGYSKGCTLVDYQLHAAIEMAGLDCASLHVSR
jgi:hypothetical protein